jgi:hypothetical protein
MLIIHGIADETVPDEILPYDGRVGRRALLGFDRCRPTCVNSTAVDLCGTMGHGHAWLAGD